MNDIYDYIIIGAGPWGLTILKELYDKKSKKVLCLEKGNEICYNLINFFPELVLHSRANSSSIYPENKLLLKNENDKIYVGELLESYKLIFNHLPIELNTELIDINIENNICILNVVKNNIHKKLYCKKAVMAYGFFDFKNKINFGISNSNVYYQYKNPNTQQKYAACIGGGYSSLDIAQYLSTKNMRVDVLSRSNLDRQILKSKNKYKSYDADWNLINTIKYKKIDKICNDEIYFDGKKIKYDIIYILIGFSNYDARNKYLKNNIKKYLNKNIYFVGSIIGDDIMSLHDRKNQPPPFSQSNLKRILGNITN